jgi:HD-GYP domain-containing protein (c-di-GMP phosphodiesterase class II)
MASRSQDECERRLLGQSIQIAWVLGTAIALRDHDTGAHNHRVALYAGALGEGLGLDPPCLRELIAGAFLHDLGKIAIPDRILLKPGPLSAEEWEVMQTHCELGAQLLGELPAFRGAIPVVRHHHERYDGSGYPDHRAGASIPMIARAFALVDVFDALVSARPYKQAFQLGRALEDLESGVGTHFDPSLAAPFIRLAPLSYRQFGSLSEDALKPCLDGLVQRHFGV